MSHFAMAYKPTNPLTIKQVETFIKAQEIISSFGIIPKWIHIANSSGVLNSKELGNKLGGVARCGTALYGIDPEMQNVKLKNVLELSSVIGQIKRLNKGEKVGYGFTYTSDRNRLIGILPIGYYEGVDPALSNVWHVYVDDTYCRILGKVNMNIATI